MSLAFSARTAVECRVNTSIPCQRLRVQHLAFSQAVRGNALVTRVPEPRAQRIVAQAVQARGDAEDTYDEDDSFQERVVQVRRVTKVVKGGKQLRFRAVVSVNVVDKLHMLSMQSQQASGGHTRRSPISKESIWMHCRSLLEMRMEL